MGRHPELRSEVTAACHHVLGPLPLAPCVLRLTGKPKPCLISQATGNALSASKPGQRRQRCSAHKMRQERPVQSPVHPTCRKDVPIRYGESLFLQHPRWLEDDVSHLHHMPRSPPCSRSENHRPESFPPSAMKASEKCTSRFQTSPQHGGCEDSSSA